MNERRRQRLWRLWLATVAVIVVGSLLWWSVLLMQRPSPPAARYADRAASVQTARTPETARGQRSFRVATPAPVGGPGIVWVNTRSGIYHYPGKRWYGRTIQGKYESEADALADGDRAALNERRPAGFGETERPWNPRD